MNTQKEKKSRPTVRRRTLLASQNVLLADEASNMSDPIGFDDLPFIEEKLKLMFEPNEKEAA